MEVPSRAVGTRDCGYERGKEKGAQRRTGDEAAACAGDSGARWGCLGRQEVKKPQVTAAAGQKAPSAPAWVRSPSAKVRFVRPIEHVQ
jgi:hypothetical protein